MSTPDVPDSPSRSDRYMRRLELAGGRIDDAVRRLAPRDRVWILNAKLREELNSWPADQAAAREGRSSSA